MGLSFADSLKKAQEQERKNVVLKTQDFLVESIDIGIAPMTLENIENNNETMIAAYSGDDGNWTEHTEYAHYSDYSDDNISEIDSNKNIELHEKQFNITQEENSQYIPFEMQRYYDGFDLTKTLLSIHYITSDGYNGSSKPVNVTYNNDKIRFAWLVDGNATHIAGTVKFEIHATGINSNGDAYVWKSRSTDKMNVLQSLIKQNNTIILDDTWVSILVKDVAENVAEQIANLQVAEQVEAAEAAANTALMYAANAENYANTAAASAKGAVQEVLINGNYATTTYVDDAVKAADVSEQLKDYALKTEIPKNVSSFENDVGYLTEHQSLDNYALKTEVPSIEGLATEVYVQEKMAEVDVSEQLKDYAKSADVYTKEEVDTAISNVEVDLSGYYTKTEVDSKTDALSSSIETNETGISSLSTTVQSLQSTVNGLDTSPRLTYDASYNTNGDYSFILYEITNEGDSESEVRSERAKFVIQGGGGGSSTSSVLKIEYITKTPIVATTNDDVVIKYNFSGVDSSGDAVLEGAATWKVAGAVVATNTAVAGENSFDITEYLSLGTQKVNLSITDDAGSLVTKSWTVQKIDVRIESTFNDTLTCPIGTVSFDYTPYGAISKDVHFVLDGTEIGTITTSASGIPMGYTIPSQEHGSHLLEVYMTAEVNNNTIESNHIVKDILWYDSTSTIPVIGCVQQNFIARQYDITNITYTVYDPKTETPEVVLAIDGNVVSTLKLDTNTQIWQFKTDEVGDHVLTITCGETIKTLNVKVEKLNINVEPVTAGLVVDFNPVGRSNSDADRVWSNGDVAMTVSDNFDWVNGGYHIDSNGDQYFCIKAGTSAEINYHMFEDDAKRNGKEMKLIFKTTNVQEVNAQFLSCIDDTTGSDHIGIEMFAHEAYIYGAADKLNLKYSEEDIIEFEFNISKNTESVTEICGYEDGVPTRHLVYDDSFSFTQSTPKVIKLGSDKCDLHIYRLKIYNTSLTDRGILNNFIADARNATEMIARYDRNQIYDENQSLTPEILAEKCPWLRVYVVSAPYFTNKKSDKVPYTTIRQIYKNGDPILDNWVCYDCSHSGQGTSSDNYGASARNLDFIMNKSQRDGVDPYFILGDGKTRATEVSLTRTSIPNAYFNFKANVASSNHFTNAKLAKRYNEFNPYTLPYVREDESIISYIKTTMEFHNAVVFIQETDTDLSTHREFADNLVHFYSIGNIGDSKKTDDTRLVDPTDKYECINEICDVELPLSDWPNTPEAFAALEAEKFDKSGSYEWRYIWEDGTDEENAEVREYCKQKWIEMYKFVVQSTDEEFKANFEDYFVLDSVLYYYLFALRYCLADNLAKNSFWHYGKTGEIDAQGNPIRKWDLSWAYDMD